MTSSQSLFHLNSTLKSLLVVQESSKALIHIQISKDQQHDGKGNNGYFSLMDKNHNCSSKVITEDFKRVIKALI